MKILLSFLISFLFVSPVLAEEESYYDVGRTCNYTEIQRGLKALQNVTYDLEYIPNMTDREGEPLEGYIKMNFLNLPQGYLAMAVSSNWISYFIQGDVTTVALPGGVYTIYFYDERCNTPVKSLNVKVPFYKTFCGVDVDCKDNPWFDGTFENTATNQNRPIKNKVSTVLVVILVLLIIIIGIIVGFILKRRHDRAHKI